MLLKTIDFTMKTESIIDLKNIGFAKIDDIVSVQERINNLWYEIDRVYIGHNGINLNDYKQREEILLTASTLYLERKELNVLYFKGKLSDLHSAQIITYK